MIEGLYIIAQTLAVIVLGMALAGAVAMIRFYHRARKARKYMEQWEELRRGK